MSDLFERMMVLTEQLTGKSADYITHALKVIDGGEGGTMAGGIQRIITAMNVDKIKAIAEAKVKYGAGGIGIGAVATGVVMGGAWLYSWKKGKKQHEKECQEIIEAFEMELKHAQEDSAVSLVEEHDTETEDFTIESAV